MIINIVFTLLIIAVFIFGCNKLNKNENTDYFPSLLSSIGVLGTFVGIIIGLWNFDTTDISASITTLLDGLKTAFITSILGMAFSMIFTIVEKQSKRKIPTENQAMQSQAEKFFENISKQTTLLEQINTTLRNNKTDIINAIETNDSNIVSVLDKNSSNINNLSSLVVSSFAQINDNHKQLLPYIKDFTSEIEIRTTQVDLITSTLQDIKSNEEDLRQSFDNLAKEIKENNINALVDVMRKVTEEFNTQMTTIINRLVKENFDQLNTSVERLNTWQQENKTMLQDITLKYHNMQKAFENTSSTLSDVREKTAELTKDGGKLSVMIDNLQKAIVTDNNLDKLTESLKESVDNIENATAKYKKTTENVNSWIKSIVALQANIEVLTSQISEIDINRSLQKISNEYYAQLSNTLQALDNCLVAIINRSRNNVR